jgi:hypothetical protein
MNRRSYHPPVLLLALGVAAAGLPGCGDEEFSDEQFGVLDLASYYDGGTQANAAAPAVPEQIEANPGYLGGQFAEYYDFGLVPSVVDLATAVPKSVRVQPMYFFFDLQGRPLFAPPVRELRNGVDWIRGGQDVLDVNPKDYCEGAADQEACKRLNEAEKRKSYPLRRRDPLIDPNRSVDDYQRPLVDLHPLNQGTGAATQYTGLWEIVEVTAPASYVPDSIKHVATLQRALASGKFRLRQTGKVINCPMVDERTYVNRGLTARRVFHPRIEIWYRRLLSYCFLANGWETLGREDGVRYFADSDSERLDTFDVSRFRLGEGPSATERVEVPVGRAYEPAIIVSDQSDVNPATFTRVAFNVITTSRPRQGFGDPPGYTPMRWMFDVPAPDDYQTGAWKSEDELDLTNALPRRRSPTFPIVKNLPARGVAPRCSFPPVPGYAKEGTNPLDEDWKCGVLKPDPDPSRPAGNFIVDSRGDPACNAERDPLSAKDPPLECNPDTCFCDAPYVGYGQACGPGIAQCQRAGDKFSEDGYRCFPPWGGFCQKSCFGTNTRFAENAGKEPTRWVDSRCGDGGPGYVCNTSVATCIKYCDQNVSDLGQCSVNATVVSEMRDIQEGQTCQDFGIQVCAWPDTWDAKEFPIPQ